VDKDAKEEFVRLSERCRIKGYDQKRLTTLRVHAALAPCSSPIGRTRGAEKADEAASNSRLAQPTHSSHTPLPLSLMRILGIDPGLNITGYGVLDTEGRHLRLVEAGVVRGKTRGSLTARLREIYEGVAEVIAGLKPEAMAIEELYSHYERPRTAILMGHARGVICLAAALADIPVHHYSATQIKRILTGNGRAPKSQVQRAIQRELLLPAVPDPPDVADALAIALCHFYLKDKLKA
jgi:crossover junction endodeoxyribonuclease RuvC